MWSNLSLVTAAPLAAGGQPATAPCGPARLLPRHAQQQCWLAACCAACSSGSNIHQTASSPKKICLSLAAEPTMGSLGWKAARQPAVNVRWRADAHEKPPAWHHTCIGRVIAKSIAVAALTCFVNRARVPRQLVEQMPRGGVPDVHHPVCAACCDLLQQAQDNSIQPAVPGAVCLWRRHQLGHNCFKSSIHSSN